MSSHLNPSPSIPLPRSEGNFSYLPVHAGFLWSFLAWPMRSHGELQGAEIHFLFGLTPSWCSSVWLTIPGPLEPLSKAQVMAPSSRLIGWWVTAVFIDKAPCPGADGSKEIKYNGACCQPCVTGGTLVTSLR